MRNLMFFVSGFLLISLIAFASNSYALDRIPADENNTKKGTCFAPSFTTLNMEAEACLAKIDAEYSWAIYWGTKNDAVWYTTKQGGYFKNFSNYTIYSCSNPDYPNLVNTNECEEDETLITVCPSDGYYLNKDGSSGSEENCDRYVPTLQKATGEANFVICLQGMDEKPNWPDCSSGLDQKYVDGVDADAERAKQSALDAFSELSSEEKAQVLDIIKNNDISAEDALAMVQDATSDIIENNETVKQYESDYSEIPELKQYAQDTQAEATTALSNSAEANSNATQAKIALLNANQAVSDAQQTNNTAQLESAKADQARAELNNATSQSQADALAQVAKDAATQAETALNALVDSMNSLSNELIPSNEALTKSNNLVVASNEALIRSNTALANSISALASNGITAPEGVGGGTDPEEGGGGTDPVEGGGGTDPVEGGGGTDPEEGEEGEEGEEEPLKDTPTGKSFYESDYLDGFSGVYKDIATDFEDGEFYKGMSTFIVPAGSSAIPEWNLCFNTGIINLGCSTVSVPAYVWNFLKICFIVCAGFLCRAIVMGG